MKLDYKCFCFGVRFFFLLSFLRLALLEITFFLSPDFHELWQWLYFTGVDFTKGLKSRFRLNFVKKNVKSVVLELVDFTKQLSP